MTWHRSIINIGRTVADHDSIADEGFVPASRSFAWHTQRSAGPQTCGQFPAQRTTSLDVQGLIDRLMTDPHGIILWIVNLKAVGDLLRAPCCRPPAALTMNRSPFLPYHRRAVESDANPIGDLPSQTLLDILAKDRVARQLAYPRSPSGSVSVPLSCA